jgi:WW domain-binding protein 4
VSRHRTSVSSTRKRPRDAALEEDEEDARTFKMRQKNLGRGLDDIYDPGVIVIKPKETKALQVAEEEQPTSAPLVWKPTEWSVGPVREERSTEKATEIKPDPDEGDVKPVVEAPDTEKDAGSEEKAAVEVPTSGGMFKKRKVPKAGTTKRGNRGV